MVARLANAPPDLWLCLQLLRPLALASAISLETPESHRFLARASLIVPRSNGSQPSDAPSPSNVVEIDYRTEDPAFAISLQHGVHLPGRLAGTDCVVRILERT